MQEAFERLGGHRTLHARAAKASEELVPVVWLPSSVVLDDERQGLLDSLVSRVAPAAGKAPADAAKPEQADAAKPAATDSDKQ